MFVVGLLLALEPLRLVEVDCGSVFKLLWQLLLSPHRVELYC